MNGQKRRLDPSMLIHCLNSLKSYNGRMNDCDIKGYQGVHGEATGEDGSVGTPLYPSEGLLERQYQIGKDSRAKKC